MSGKAKVIGPGGSTSTSKETSCKVVGPGGTGSGSASTTKGSGYGNRTEGHRAAYQRTGQDMKGKA